MTEVKALRKVMEVGNDSSYSGSFVITRDGACHVTDYWAADKVHCIERLLNQYNCMDGQCMCALSIQITNVYLNQLNKVTSSPTIFTLCYLDSLFYSRHISFAISDLIVTDQKEKEHLC